eukprot:Opistho-2@37400
MSRMATTAFRCLSRRAFPPADTKCMTRGRRTCGGENTLCLPRASFATPWMPFSQPATILRALANTIGADALRQKETLVVHVVGAAMPEVNMCLVYEEILHVLPALNSLRIVLIGPDLPEFGHIDEESLTCCPACTSAGRTRKLSVCHELYHELVPKLQEAADGRERPDVIVAFNSGIHEAETDLWAPTLDLLARTAGVCVFTSYTRGECDLDEAVLRDKGMEIVQPAALNPFAGARELLDPMEVDVYYRQNNYVLIARGKGGDTA